MPRSSTLKSAVATVLLIAALAPLPQTFAPVLGAAENEFKPDAKFTNDDQAKDLLAEGVQEYRAGRYKAAAAAFHAALKLEPENKQVYLFYLAAGDALLWEMHKRDELKDVLKDVTRRANIYRRELRRDDAYINLLIAKLEKSTDERLVASNELVSVGPIAVPHLVARLGDNRQDDLRTYVRVVLTQMGHRAVIPLTEALNAKDQRLVASIALVLTDIGDTRPLPKLKQLLDDRATSDTTKRVITNAIAGIAQRAGMKDVPAGDALHFTEALRYFRNNDAVRQEMIANESLVWRWTETGTAADGAANAPDAPAGAGSTSAKQLTYIRVPRYAWNELIAEELLFDGAAAYTAFTAYQPLLAATLAAQEVESTVRLRLAKERTTPVEQPDEAADAIAERIAALDDRGAGAAYRVRMAGAAHLYRAVQQAVISERYDVAAYLLRQLQDRRLAYADTSLPTPDQGLVPDRIGTVLVAALDHPEKTVRYQAAITLAHLDPTLAHFNAEKVVPILAEAVGEWGLRVVAVVDQDYRQRNTAREQLQQQGYLALTVIDGFELMQRLQESPVKDAIVISGELLPTVRDEHGSLINVPEQNLTGPADPQQLQSKTPADRAAKLNRSTTLVDALAQDWRSEKTPIFISLPEDPELSAKITKAFEGKANVKGFIKKPFNGVELNNAIDGALKAQDGTDRKLFNLNREDAEDISLRAAQALQHLDPARTQYDPTVASEALVKTLENRDPKLRIEALKALGLAAAHKNGAGVKALIAKVTDFYGAQDATLAPDLRAAYLAAIGQLDPNTDASVNILLAALKHEDAGVRRAAHEAVGHANAIANELILRYQQQQRLDVRGAGAGKG